MIFTPELLVNLEVTAKKVLSEYDTYFDWRIKDKEISQTEQNFILMKQALHKAYKDMMRLHFIADINRGAILEIVKDEYKEITDKLAIRYFIISVLEQEKFRLTYDFQIKVANLINDIPSTIIHSQEEWDFMKTNHEHDMNILRKRILELE